MAMKNLDKLAQQKADIVARIQQAVTDGNTETFQAAFTEYTDMLQEAVLAEAKGLIQAADNQVLAGRGVRALTSEETNYYQKVIEAMKSTNPQQALSGFDDVLPKTVIDAIFEDIAEEHPLLDAIKFESTGALVEYLYSTLGGRHLATWGKLCSTITEQLSAGFAKLSLSQTKLSAFLPICKAMLDLGPAWLDRYVRATLYEAIANGLEDGIINGRGIANDGAISEPIGMIKNLESYNITTGYADKMAIPVADFGPATYGGLVAELAVNRNGLQRVVTEVLLVVNPVDYLTKIVPATTVKKPDGTYANNIFPFPTKVVQSAYMEQGKAALGIGNRYLMAMGAGTNGGRIEYSDEYKFLEDERYYLIKLYGTGRPKDNTSFLYLDISNLQPLVPDVNVNNWPPVTPVDVVTDPLNVNQVFDARLASLKVGALVLSPAFNKSIMYYEAATTDATNKITAAPMDGEATIEILHGVTPVANGDSATWEAGENTVTITVTSGTETETYTVVVTKS
jgi:hypothetical protein